jgi:hypothetical protein
MPKQRGGNRKETGNNIGTVDSIKPIELITLTVPNERRFFGVVRLLVGGLAARLELSYEQMDDLQLAVEAVLLSESHSGETVTLEASINGGSVVIAIGPVDEKALAGVPDVRSVELDQSLDLDRVLARLVAQSDFVERGGQSWLRIEQRVPEPGRPR